MTKCIAKFPAAKGLPPLEEPIAGAAIEALLREENAKDAAEHAANRPDDPARLRASDAYKCARQLGFRMEKVPKDIELDARALMTFRIGDVYHDIVQRAIIRHLNAKTEVDFDLRPKLSLYGRADFAYDDVVGEIKSQSGYGFDVSTGAKKSADGPGPKVDHLLQPGFAAVSPQIAASKIHIVYLNKDRGVVAEWLIGLDDPLPHLGGQSVRELVNIEAARLRSVLADLDDGCIPARVVPGYGTVDEPPPEGSRAQPWNCRFCAWQPTCAGLESGPVPIDLVKPREPEAVAA